MSRRPTPAHAPPPAGEENQYATKRYWDARYAAVVAEDVFEWFLSFEDLRPLLAFVKRRASVLDLGCGTSRLLCDMREAGYGGRLVGVDCSAAALRSVRERSAAHDVELMEADATTLHSFMDAAFDLVVDKGTGDALFSGAGGPVLPLSTQRVAENASQTRCADPQRSLPCILGRSFD